MLNDNVKELLNNSMWDLGTYGSDGPNVVPVAFKDITPEGKLVVGDVFLDFVMAPVLFYLLCLFLYLYG